MSSHKTLSQVAQLLRIDKATIKHRLDIEFPDWALSGPFAGAVAQNHVDYLRKYFALDINIESDSEKLVKKLFLSEGFITFKQLFIYFQKDVDSPAQLIEIIKSSGAVNVEISPNSGIRCFTYAEVLKIISVIGEKK